MAIDVTFDFRSDAGGRDPDSASPTLREYHRRLWGRRLPSGASFDLSATTSGVYLYHSSELGDFFLSSDAVMATFLRWPRQLQPVVSRFSTAQNEFLMHITYTIGAMMVFPGNQIDRKWTINQARGCNRSIADRFDLTLECIRRHYLGQDSPLADTLARYPKFFDLFSDFAGYVRFFLLDDLIDDGVVRFFMRFDGFHSSAIPKDDATYAEYRRRSIRFVEARNRRIAQLAL